MVCWALWLVRFNNLLWVLLSGDCRVCVRAPLAGVGRLPDCRACLPLQVSRVSADRDEFSEEFPVPES